MVTRGSPMHLYNAWLPPPVAELTYKEKESFKRILMLVKSSFDSTDLDSSVYATLKWISVLDLFVKAKSYIELEDVTELVLFGLQVFLTARGKLYAQVRWGNTLVRFLNKYRWKLSLTVTWRPLYDALVNTHFTRNTGPEGWRLRQRHFETITSLVRSCRRFFPPGSASEIWSEFSCFLENPWHNAAFEGSGFVRLFLPTNLGNQEFYTREWILKVMNLWDSIPNCQFWNNQWAAIVARVIKNYKSIDWEPFIEQLFSKYLNMFEVPVANGSGSYPYSADAPRNMSFLFSNKGTTPAKAIAKSIVYLIKPGSSGLERLEKLVNFLEQYYHPSNGGRWTYSLERFLLRMVITFQKRLRFEQFEDCNSTAKLGSFERTSIVNTLLKIIDRGQYSKNEHLSQTVVSSISMLSYVEPSLVLPFVAFRFHLALETMTATHQLKAALMSVAYAGRPIFFASLSTTAKHSDLGECNDLVHSLPMISLSNALLGMDANDPPKTLATMQLIGSICSNIAVLDDGMDFSFSQMINFSEWLDEFLCRLFSLLQHLEPSSALNEGLHPSLTSGTFLVEDGSYYYCMLEILFGRLSESLYRQALKRISHFVKTNILPGAVAEVGLLCCACVYPSPEEAVAFLVEPVLVSVISSFKSITPTTNDEKVKSSLSPALEISIDYQLKLLSVAISFAGPALLQYQDQLKEAIHYAFDCSSWKVNGAGDHLLRSLLGSLILYYPLDQYKCILQHPAVNALEKWISMKDVTEELSLVPKWHLPTNEEIQFANELLEFHFQSALEDLSVFSQDRIRSGSGVEKEHLKVTLLRIDSSLQGVLSCLPDFCPSSKNGNVDDLGVDSVFIAGASGVTVGSTVLREKAASVMHSACKYLLEENSDDSILLILMVRILDALVNYGSLEFDEWSNHRQSWKLQSAAIIEPPTNFIVSSHLKGKKRPRWALIDKAHMHNTWRSSQSSYHIHRTNGNVLPPESAIPLLDDLLSLTVHSYETVRGLAGKALIKLIKRWPSMIPKCVISLARNLLNPGVPEYAVLGSCSVLSSQTVLKHLAMDPTVFSAFIIGILSSSHHESLKAQKAINELFVKYNIHFSGVSKNIFRMSGNHTDGKDFADLLSQIESLSFDSSSLHWRYNLMANRVLLLLALESRNHPQLSARILREASGHFLKNLRSQLPQTRILAISALNTLLKNSSYKVVDENALVSPNEPLSGSTTRLEEALSEIFMEEGFFRDTFNSLSHVHIITDNESVSSRGSHGDSSFQSLADKSITRFYFDFLASWPRTRSWITSLGSDTFYSNFARIFKRLIQECGMSVLLTLRGALDECANAEERAKQCVAAEALAGVLHSDIDGLAEAWESWIMTQVRSIILLQSVESIPEWVACIRYAVTGKGRLGTRVPLLRPQILNCLMTPLPLSASTSVIAKRYTFLAAALSEISPQKMPVGEIKLHHQLLEELLDHMAHSSAQVREAIGVTLSVVCSNIRLGSSFTNSGVHELANNGTGWPCILMDRASEMVTNILKSNQSDYLESESQKDMQDGVVGSSTKNDMKWIETLFHFIISTLKSGRSSYMLDVVAGLIYPILSLQDTSNKDLSMLAKAAFELLKWIIFCRPHLQTVVSLILASVSDSNWRIRSVTLTYLRTFMYRHSFIITHSEKQKIWRAVENLLRDSQVEVREHAAAVLSGLMRGEDEIILNDFRGRASVEATTVLKNKFHRNHKSHNVAAIHGVVLALAASVLSVPYDMPSWLPEHVTLLARFGREPLPIKSTVTKAVAEFRRTHADTWNIQKDCFTEEQLEMLADTSSSSYFA